MYTLSSCLEECYNANIIKNLILYIYSFLSSCLEERHNASIIKISYYICIVCLLFWRNVIMRILSKISYHICIVFWLEGFVIETTSFVCANVTFLSKLTSFSIIIHSKDCIVLCHSALPLHVRVGCVSFGPIEDN